MNRSCTESFRCSLYHMRRNTCPAPTAPPPARSGCSNVNFLKSSASFSSLGSLSVVGIGVADSSCPEREMGILRPGDIGRPGVGTAPPPQGYLAFLWWDTVALPGSRPPLSPRLLVVPAGTTAATSGRCCWGPRPQPPWPKRQTSKTRI